MKSLNIKKTTVVLILSILALVLIILISLSFGSVKISFKETIMILLNRTDDIKSTHIYIIKNLRIPRTLCAIFVGMALSISGAVFQAIFKNPMADPYILGISSGAACGVTLGAITSLINFIPGVWGTPLFSFLGAILTAITIYLISDKLESGTLTLLLSGIAINFLLSALMSLMMFFNRNALEDIIYWNMGSFAVSSYEKIVVIAPIIIICIIFILRYYRELDILLIGEDQAKSIGVEVKKTTAILLAIATLLTSSAVALSGIIGFIGLIIPHVVRIIVGPSHKKLLPISLIFGAFFALLADTFGRSVIPNTEIPISIITAILGAPYFIYLLKKQKRLLY
jgi:iron complex transport system permease protein